MKGLTDLLRIVRTHIIRECRCTASQISDAHRAGITISVHFTERLHLQCACKGYQNRCCHICCVRDKSHRKKDQDLKKQNPLSPMQLLGILESCLKPLREKYTRSKCKYWEQIFQSRSPLSHHKVRAHQHNVTGLGIREYLVPGKICIRVLKASGQRQKDTRNKGFRHLHIGSQFLKFFIHARSSCLVFCYFLIYSKRHIHGIPLSARYYNSRI